MRTRILRLILFAILISGTGIIPAGRAAQQDQSLRQLFERARLLEEKNQDLAQAIQLYEQVVSKAKEQRALAAKAQLQIGLIYERLGRKAEAQRAFRAAASDFADQPEIARQARERITNGATTPGAAALSTRLVWSGPGVDTLGAPSRDGAYLTFRDSATEDLAIRDLATGQTRPLTKHQTIWESAYGSVPSPDGKQVAYTWYNPDNHYGLRIVGLDGGEPRVLYRNAEVAYVYPADWSPDGKSILAIFSDRKKGDQMVLLSVADGSVRVLETSTSGAPRRPRFSPDGRYIAYSLPQRPGSPEHDIFLLELETGRKTTLVQHPANDAALDWTPDGKRYLFRSDRTGTDAAWLIQVADGKPQGTAELAKPELGPNFRPLGFTRKGSYYYGIVTGRSDVYIAELDLATGKLLTPPSPATQRFEGSNNKPDWSPDGRNLLFLSNRGSTAAWAARTLYVRSLQSGEVRELVSKLQQVATVRWSPDGHSLLAVGRTSEPSLEPAEGYGIFRINVQTGDFTRITRVGPGGPVWSRDGNSIFRYVSHGSKTTSLVRRDLATGQELELHSLPASSYYVGGIVAPSPNGQQLAFVVGDADGRAKVLKVMPTAGGEPRDVLRGVPLAGNSITWTPDSQGLLFTARSPGELETGLWLISLPGGEPRKLGLTAESMRDVSIHPDGRHIAFTAGGESREVWVMENFLPALKASR